ncbi:HD domain-containing protein [Methanobacterium alkalithermotolerans]|uniref:HD domain-containing protein n=1 Tax=Methanobacterium alkalithermotolerans TaxID=2731220 RepID=A0A8T8KFQ5_9EURY|nr:HD domain-containing protein [Methanobacterium alkalithermotolerans]QUH24121.1 HD domain-containing protein [Methanobacterium alkalithermotolerans]RJS48944.1 MAG: phosphodiesterase [Methanobacterium sp.]
MKFIRDSVHGNLHINDLEIKLVDTPQIQRLRRIKQLGFTFLIYPGANHTRFEHSIGTMYLASQMADHLNLDEDKKSILRICALLHDAGHGPFSHVSEAVLDDSHEVLTSRVIKNSILGDIISENYDINDIIDIINGKGVLGQIISGELDVDRMDYLIRDSHYTGVAYGIIDIERLIYNMKLENNLVLDKKGVQAAESTLVARYFMYPSVYQHHTTRIVNSMFRRSLRKLIDQNIIDSKKIYQYDDADMIMACRNQDGFIKDMIKRMDNRDLFKKVDSLKLSELEDPQKIFKIKREQIKKAENEICEEKNINPDYLIIDMPEYPSFDEMRTLVSVGDGIVNLSQISSIVGALRDARFNHADLCIYVPEEHTSKLADFDFYDYLDLPEKINKHDKQMRLVSTF